VIIGHLATQDDRNYLHRFRELIGAHAVKMTASPIEYITVLGALIKSNNLDALIVTCPDTLVTVLRTQPDFKQPVTLSGKAKNLTLDDYAGSMFYIPESIGGRAIPCIVLNPLSHLVRTPEGPHVFKRFISKLTTPERWPVQTQFTWELWSEAKSAHLFDMFSKSKLLAVDIETYRNDETRGIHCVGYCALFEDGTTHSVVVPHKTWAAHAFCAQLNATNVAKIFQNGLYDNLYFARWNMPCNNWLWDTQHLFHSWYSELPKRLDFITAYSVREVRYWKDDTSGSEFDLFEYNARDCWATLHTFMSLMLEIPDWARKNYLMEFPMVFPCLHTECDGLSLDKARFDAAKAEAEAKLGKHKTRIAAWLGAKFNPASSQQCVRLLQILGIANAEGSDIASLNAAAAAHPLNELVISEIVAYRKQAKLLSTYFVWEKFWNGRLYYKSNPAGTDTGRLSSTESSFWTGVQIQNIPRGKAVKQYIMCDAGWDGLGEGDYSQSEARCVAYISGCMELIKLVESSYDYHTWNATKFFGVAYEAVSSELRDLSKRVNHGSNYNMGARVLLDTMGPRRVAEAKIVLELPAKWSLLQVCQHLLDSYAKAYPEVKRDWYQHITRMVGTTKKLVSAIGWTRYFFNSNLSTNKQALNAAVAHGPQNLSVSIINRKYYAIWKDSIYGDLRGRVRLKAQIHDSIFFAFKGAEVPEIVRQRMIDDVSVKDIKGVTRILRIPADMSIGKGDVKGKAKYWSELK